METDVKTTQLEPKKVISIRKTYYIFLVSSQGVVRTISLLADSKKAAMDRAELINPGCEVKFLWEHE